MPYIIGLNSGSSFDGIDAVLCTIEIDSDGHPARPKYIDALTVDWPEDLQEQVIRAFENKLSIFELARLNYAAGAVYADAAIELMRKNKIEAKDVDVLGYDGQTIYQEPPDRPLIAQMPKGGATASAELWTKFGYPCGLFIVESGVVAGLTDVTTITQFRPTDHVHCGSGAPLMQYLDFVSFRHDGPTVTLNIGGIANLQLANADRDQMMAFDTGPGNVMIDHAAKVRTGRAYDKDGELAAKGKVIDNLLQELEGHEFFQRNPPRSAWRLDFGSAYADDVLKRYSSSSTEDLLATLTMFTATSIERALTHFILPKVQVKNLIASGGGTRNNTLIQWLTKRLETHGVATKISDEFGLPAAYKEAIKFATLAFATKNRLCNNIPAASGASKFAVLGKLTWAPSVGSVDGITGYTNGSH